MAGVYRPGPYDTKVNPGLCKAAVPVGGRSVRRRQCQNKPQRDGWCHVHHPEAEVKREQERRERWAWRTQNSPSARYAREVERLRERLAQARGDAIRECAAVCDCLAQENIFARAASLAYQDAAREIRALLEDNDDTVA